jgi:hypothetical protein
MPRTDLMAGNVIAILAAAMPGELPTHLHLDDAQEVRSGPRPDLNGMRVRPPDGPVYLIDRGYRRLVPNPETSVNLFRSWDGIVTNSDVDAIPQSAQLGRSAILIKGTTHSAIYLTDQGKKRWVTSEGAMHKYHFNANGIFEIPGIVVASIPDGEPIW